MTPSLSSTVSAVVRRRTLSVTGQLVLLLALHLLLWTWVGISSRSNFDAPGDMVEAYAWSQGWQWGYYKHPPLSAWVVGLWFSIVPEGHAGYSLLSAFNAALGLAGLAVLAREFLPARWVLLTVAVASLAPGITTLAMRFNANAILIATWPWTVAFFVRFMRRGRWSDALLCGLAGALAVLGKYYSGVLLLSLVATALWMPAWRRRVFSAPFAGMLGLFSVLLAPHLIWLLTRVHGPLQYAQAATGAEGPGASTMRALTFALAQCVFPLLAFLALRLALRGPQANRGFLQAALAPLRPRSEPLWLMALLPVLVTMAATVMLGARTASVWGLAMACSLALLAADRAREAGAELCLGRLWKTLGVIWVLVAVLSPVWWQTRANLATPAVAEPREELAHALARQWRAEQGSPLPWVSGTRALAASVAFYAKDHPGYWSFWDRSTETPWVTDEALRSRGGVIVCDRADRDCIARAELWTSRRETLSVAKQTRGVLFAPQAYEVFWVAPRPQPALALAR